ncbi:MAG: transposase [Bryobacteraceae bacterium]
MRHETKAMNYESKYQSMGASQNAREHQLARASQNAREHQKQRVIQRFWDCSRSWALRKEFPSLATRLPTLWTNSYFVSTVGGSPLAIVKQYIENQKRSER